MEVRGGSKSGPGEDQSPRAGKNAVGKINPSLLKDPQIRSMRLR